MKYMKVSTGSFVATPRTRELIKEVLDSGIIGYGSKSRELEREFARIHDSSYGTLSNSGTSSLHIALQTLKEIHRWDNGDEVIVPATTFVATANIVKHNKMTPVFVDVDPDYYGIDTTEIEDKITDRTRVIIPVHLFGQSCNMTEVMRIAQEYELKVIEDSCETMFVTHKMPEKHLPVGSIGDIGCFSFYVAHLLVAGVGGIAITDNSDYSAKMRSLVNHGLQIDNLNLDMNNSPQPMIGREFKFDSLGHSFRITEFEAAVALAQLDTHKSMINSRQKNGRHYTSSLKLINKSHDPNFYQSAQIMEGNEHAFMMYPIVLGQHLDKKYKPFLTKFLNDAGIETRDMLPILNQPAYSYLSNRDYPVSQWLIENGFYVGCHQYLTTEHIQHVLNALSLFANMVENKAYD